MAGGGRVAAAKNASPQDLRWVIVRESHVEMRRRNRFSRIPQLRGAADEFHVTDFTSGPEQHKKFGALVAGDLPLDFRGTQTLEGDRVRMHLVLESYAFLDLLQPFVGSLGCTFAGGKCVGVGHRCIMLLAFFFVDLAQMIGNHRSGAELPGCAQIFLGDVHVAHLVLHPSQRVPIGGEGGHRANVREG